MPERRPIPIVMRVAIATVLATLVRVILSIALGAIGAGWEILPLPGTAVAQEDARSAKFLIQSCQAFLSGNAGLLPFLQGRCFGVIDGLAYGSPEVCPPPTTTGEEMVRVVVQHIGAAPDRIREDFRILALEALQSRWPCR